MPIYGQDVQAGLGRGLSELSRILLGLQAAEEDRRRFAEEQAYRKNQGLRADTQAQLDREAAMKQQDVSATNARQLEQMRQTGDTQRATSEHQFRTQEGKADRLARADEAYNQNLTRMGVGSFNPHAGSNFAHTLNQPGRLNADNLPGMVAGTAPGQRIGDSEFFRLPNDPNVSQTFTHVDDARDAADASREIRMTESGMRDAAVRQLQQEASANGRNFDPSDDRNISQIEHATANMIQTWRMGPLGRNLYRRATGQDPPSMGRQQGQPTGSVTPAPIVPQGPPPLNRRSTDRVTVSGPPPLVRMVP